jgi:hypothetical protein
MLKAMFVIPPFFTRTVLHTELMLYRQVRHLPEHEIRAPDQRAPLRIQFGVQANLFDSGLRQEKATLASTKADSPSLPECKNLLLVAQKQLIELP